MPIKFSKWQGCGNDFILVNGFTENIKDFKRLSTAICDRHFGVGADGLIVLLPSKTCDFRMRIFNTDGSEAEMCGNGIRCFAGLIHEIGLTKEPSFTVETGAGVIKPKLLPDSHPLAVCVDMGEPILAGEQIPVKGYGNNKIINEPITVNGKTFRISCVSMGNPHCVIFVDDINSIDIKTWGPILETYDIFPSKTNVEFVRVIDREHLRMRVWERGAAITLACGTGSCASLVASSLNGLTDRKVSIQLDGGELSIDWDVKDNRVYMTGPAQKVFEGMYDE